MSYLKHAASDSPNLYGKIKIMFKKPHCHKENELSTSASINQDSKDTIRLSKFCEITEQKIQQKRLKLAHAKFLVE